MKQDFIAIWVSFTEAITRFWNNRFIRENDQIVYLRMELAKSQSENSKLLGYILEMANPAKVEAEPELDLSNFKPVNQREPWHVRQRRLEQESRNKAIQLASEARENLEKTKSTEDLEDELLGGNGAR